MIDEKRLAEYEKEWMLLGWYEFNEMFSTIKALWKVARAAEACIGNGLLGAIDDTSYKNWCKAMSALKEKP